MDEKHFVPPSYRNKIHVLTQKKKDQVRMYMRRDYEQKSLNNLCKLVQIDRHILDDWCQEDAEIKELCFDLLVTQSPNKKLYDPTEHPKMAFEYMSGGGSKNGLAGKLGVAASTMMTWYHTYTDFREAYDAGWNAGQLFYDEVGKKQLLNPDTDFDNQMFKHMQRWVNRDQVKKGFAAKNTKNMIKSIMERFEEENSEMTPETVNTFVKLIETQFNLTQVDEMELKIKSQADEIERLKGGK